MKKEKRKEKKKEKPKKEKKLKLTLKHLHKKMSMMKFTQRDFNAIIATGVGGMIVAGLWEVLNIIVAKKFIGELKIPTENLHKHDKYLLMLLAHLEQKAAPFNPLDFRRVVTTCDKLITLKLSIRQTDTEEKKAYNRAHGLTFLNLIKNTINHILAQNLEPHCDGAFYVDCEDLFNRVKVQMEKHFFEVMSIT